MNRVLLKQDEIHLAKTNNYKQMKTEDAEFISLGEVNVKGFANPIEVYRLL